MQETQVPSLGREDPLEKGTATHSSILAWRSPWTQEPGRLQSLEFTASQTQLSDWHFHFHYKHRGVCWVLEDGFQIFKKIPLETGVFFRSLIDYIFLAHPSDAFQPHPQLSAPHFFSLRSSVSSPPSQCLPAFPGCLLFLNEFAFLPLFSGSPTLPPGSRDSFHLKCVHLSHLSPQKLFQVRYSSSTLKTTKASTCLGILWNGKTFVQLLPTDRSGFGRPFRLAQKLSWS